MTIIVNSATCDASHTTLIKVESSFVRGYAGLQIIGNTTEVCRDGKERAKTALESLGIFIPPSRLIVSLTPGELRKDGSQFDLPLAVSLASLICQRQLTIDSSRWLFAAELGLNGELRAIKGSISFALLAISKNLEGLIVPKDNLQELLTLKKLRCPGIDQLEVIGFDSLREVLEWLFNGLYPCSSRLIGAPYLVPTKNISTDLPNFDDMSLNNQLEKLALVVAAGDHSLLLRGVPGSGKSMFAARVRSILPAMPAVRHLEALQLASSQSSHIDESLLLGRPPMRNPHHHASAAALMGNHERPGEISLAHGGVLLLDELPEFRRDVLEGLREPLQSGEVSVSRSKQKVTWKAKFQLLATCNNCGCGYAGSEIKRCCCSVNELRAYYNRLSGPILDRIDIHFNMPEPDPRKQNLHDILRVGTQIQKTQDLRDRVEAARSFAAHRNQKFGVGCNADLPSDDLVTASGLEKEVFVALVKNVTEGSVVSQRSLFRMLRVARTLADVDQSEQVREFDIKQAWKWQASISAMERGEHLSGLR